MPQRVREKADLALRSQRQHTITVLSCLLAVQDAFGHIPKLCIDQVAKFTGSTVNDVWGVISFYTNFSVKPPGEHILEVCWGTSCHILGAMDIAKSVLEETGLENEGTSLDGRVTVRFNTCLGACANAPVVSVDHKLKGRMTPDKAKVIVGEIKNVVTEDLDIER